MRVIRYIWENLHMNFSLKHTRPGFFKITFKKFFQKSGKGGGSGQVIKLKGSDEHR